MFGFCFGGSQTYTVTEVLYKPSMRSPACTQPWLSFIRTNKGSKRFLNVKVVCSEATTSLPLIGFLKVQKKVILNAFPLIFKECTKKEKEKGCLRITPVLDDHKRKVENNEQSQADSEATNVELTHQNSLQSKIFKKI